MPEIQALSSLPCSGVIADEALVFLRLDGAKSLITADKKARFSIGLSLWSLQCEPFKPLAWMAC
jgi:hypothetical protein